jgi:hypothetical protein
LAWPTPPFVFAPTGLERSVEKAGVRAVRSAPAGPGLDAGARRSRCPEEAQKRGRGWVGECRSRRPLRTTSDGRGIPTAPEGRGDVPDVATPGLAGVGARKGGRNRATSGWYFFSASPIMSALGRGRVDGRCDDAFTDQETPGKRLILSCLEAINRFRAEGYQVGEGHAELRIACMAVHMACP